MKTSTTTPVSDLDEQATSEAIFADPVSYLCTFGIEAVLVAESEGSLPAAA